jgi:hypothetical protein
MEADGYSLEKFRTAEREGRQDLKSSEAQFLERYRSAQERILGTQDRTAVANPFRIVGEMLLDMLNKERREILFGAGKAMDLEKERLSTVAGQLDAAYLEASKVNAKYDELAEHIRRSIEKFDRFVRQVNGREPLLNSEHLAS